MIKSVSIDGESYVIRECGKCPFYNYGDDGCGDRCQYPKNPSKLEGSGVWGMEGIAGDCPLSLVKDCCTCKYEGRNPYADEPCIDCGITFNTVTGEETPPDKWEAKE